MNNRPPNQTSHTVGGDSLDSKPRLSMRTDALRSGLTQSSEVLTIFQKTELVPTKAQDTEPTNKRVIPLVMIMGFIAMCAASFISWRKPELAVPFILVFAVCLVAIGNVVLYNRSSTSTSRQSGPNQRRRFFVACLCFGTAAQYSNIPSIYLQKSTTGLAPQSTPSFNKTIKEPIESSTTPTVVPSVATLCESCRSAHVGRLFTCVTRINHYTAGNVGLEEAQKIVSGEYEQCAPCNPETCRSKDSRSLDTNTSPAVTAPMQPKDGGSSFTNMTFWKHMSASIMGATPGSSKSSFRQTSIGSDENLGVNDPRPVSPKGVLCINGEKGRLNNIILQNLVGLYMAYHLNRTLLVTQKMAEYYDIVQLGLTTLPQYEYKPVILQGDMNCTSHKYSIPHQLTVLERFRAFDEQTGDLYMASVGNHDVWYWLGRPPEEFYARFFRGLVPVSSIAQKADTFVANNIPKDFIAVHLRWLEGKCLTMADDKSLCCPHLEKVLTIAKSRGFSRELSIFVADDGQCDEKIREAYKERGAVMNYQGDCQGTECAVLDFELCARANFFVGTLSSTGDMNIREWRSARGHTGSSSVLSLKNTTVAKENYTAMTRYFQPGYWGWLEDCDNMPTNKRARHPCV